MAAPTAPKEKLRKRKRHQPKTPCRPYEEKACQIGSCRLKTLPLVNCPLCDLVGCQESCVHLTDIRISVCGECWDDSCHRYFDTPIEAVPKAKDNAPRAEAPKEETAITFFGWEPSPAKDVPIGLRIRVVGLNNPSAAKLNGRVGMIGPYVQEKNDLK